MTQMISARVPSDVYAQGIKKLNKMDSSVTELINAAFDYVIATDKLPVVDKMKIKPGTRRLTKNQKREFNTLFNGSNSEAVNLPTNFDYKSELSSELRAEYEALS